MRKIDRFQVGMGLGGWLTNYKRFDILPEDKRGITIGDLEHFETYITERDVEYIASLGMDHIRLGFDQIVLEESPYVYRARIFELLHNFVNWCEKYNIRPVFNMHKVIGNNGGVKEETVFVQNKELQDRFIALWLKLEEEFHDNGDIVFELLNEVVRSTPEEWNIIAERTVKALREKNKDRLIIVGGVYWNSPPSLDELKVYDDENVIYTFHSYAPFEFTHQQGVLQRDPLCYNRKMPYPCDDIERYRDYYRTVKNKPTAYENLDRIDIECLKEAMAPAFEFIKRNPDKILWCGEFGTIRHCNIKWRENWFRDMISIMKEYDMPYCVWNYLSTPNDGNRFSLVDDDNRKILSEELARIIKGEI
ncbi:MAG: glycoside hydrolase family 5 protein [Ruminococcaceae bacterium]|nr:glycoside hydrolase family 5 protein [Oscillospiraceae bacterium]